MRAVMPGFAEPVRDAQSTFRTVLAALAEPALVQRIDAVVPDFGLGTAATAVMLSLVDVETPCWASPGVSTEAREYFRFHAGARFIDEPARAAFALVANIDELPPLATFNAGTAMEPETSTTVIVVVDGFESAGTELLDGPGFAAPRSCAPRGFESRWSEVADNHRRFPCGVDLLFVQGSSIVGLPRSTRLAEVA